MRHQSFLVFLGPFLLQLFLSSPVVAQNVFSYAGNDDAVAAEKLTAMLEQRDNVTLRTLSGEEVLAVQYDDETLVLQPSTFDDNTLLDRILIKYIFSQDEAPRTEKIELANAYNNRLNIGTFYVDDDVDIMFKSQFTFLDTFTWNDLQAYLKLTAVGIKQAKKIDPQSPASLSPTASSSSDGTTYDGQLSEGDGTLDDGSYRDVHTYEGTAGEHITATMTADAFQPYLAIVSRETEEQIGRDNGSGPNGAAQIETTLSHDGTYLVIANSQNAGSTGAYQIGVTSHASSSGETVEGRLEPGDDTLDDGSYFDTEYFTGSAGETVTLTLESEAFDPFLHVMSMEGETEKIADNDDGGPGNDAHLELTLPSDGKYAIVINSYSEGSTGPYQLSIQR